MKMDNDALLNVLDERIIAYKRAKFEIEACNKVLKLLNTETIDISISDTDLRSVDKTIIQNIVIAHYESRRFKALKQASKLISGTSQDLSYTYDNQYKEVEG